MWSYLRFYGLQKLYRLQCTYPTVWIFVCCLVLKLCQSKITLLYRLVQQLSILLILCSAVWSVWVIFCFPYRRCIFGVFVSICIHVNCSIEIFIWMFNAKRVCVCVYFDATSVHTDTLHKSCFMHTFYALFSFSFCPFIVCCVDHLSKIQTNGSITCTRSKQIHSLCL